MTSIEAIGLHSRSCATQGHRPNRRPTVGHHDCETVGIPPLISRKTLGILNGGRGGAVDRSWRRRGIRGVDKGGA